MKGLLIIVFTGLLSVSVMAQSDDNTKTTTDNTETVDFSVKKITGNKFINTKLTTIQPATKITNSELKQQPKNAIDDEKLKSSSKAVKED